MKMPKMNLKGFAKSKRFKYGSYATIMTAVVIAIAVLLNVVVGILEENQGWKLDLTKNQMFSLSKQTKEMLSSLKDDVKIYTLYSAGNEDNALLEVLKRYKTANSHITLRNVDPLKNPTFVQKFDKDKLGIRPGSIIVTDQEEKKFRVINADDLFQYNQQTQTVDGFQAEQKVTGALIYVTTDKTPKMYFMEGHQEYSIDRELLFLKGMLEGENYDVNPLNLITSDVKLDPNDTLVISSPKKDLTLEEREKVKTFLVSGGKAIFMFDPMKEEMPNFESLLKLYDITLGRNLIIEGDQGHYYQSQALLVPTLEEHDITKALVAGRLAAVMPVAQSVQLPEVKKPGLEVTALMKTTNNSWAKSDLESQSPTKAEGDKPGPFVLGAAVNKVDFDNNNTTTRIVVMGTSQFIGSTQIAGLSGNVDLFMNSVGWVRNQQESLTIRPKSLAQDQLKITDYSQMILLAVLVILVIPLVVLSSGAVVWFRRKHL